MAAKDEVFVLLVNQPLVRRKEPPEVTHLKQLAERTDFDNLLQFRSLVMFVFAFSSFFRSSKLFFPFVVITFSSVPVTSLF